MPKNGNSLKNIERAKIKVLFKQGISPKEIGKTLDFTEYVIKKELYKADLIQDFIPKGRSSCVVGNTGIKDEVPGAVNVEDLKKNTYGFSAGDKVSVKIGIRDNLDTKNKDDERKNFQGKITAIYPFFFVIETEWGYNTSVLKIDILIGHIKLKKLNKKEKIQCR